ncbi:hypothetical protein [Streptomyces sp. H49]|uniref:hypothetical protein n=1 Tax=Streptomyces sp. H49 TaxID=3444117 RepID=UPI003F4AC255
MGERTWTSLVVSHTDGSRGHASGTVDTDGITDKQAKAEVEEYVRAKGREKGHVVSPYDTQIHG